MDPLRILVADDESLRVLSLKGQLEALGHKVIAEAEQKAKKIIEEAIAITAAQSMKDMGKVMKEANAKIAGRADGKLVSDLVKERLSPPPQENRTKFP